VLLVVAAAIMLHVVFLVFNGLVIWILAFPNKERKAVHLITSQKTLPVSLTIIAFLPPGLGEPGLMTIPCIVGHLAQLFIDAFLVSGGAFERPFLLCGSPREDEDLPPPCLCWRRPQRPLEVDCQVQIETIKTQEAQDPIVDGQQV
jgi:hypothetical protein